MNLEGLIWQQVHDHANRVGIDDRLSTKEDLFQDCYEVALEAITQYNDEKNAKLSTFITSCVKNHLKDITKYENHRAIEKDSLEDWEEPVYEEDNDFMFTMKSILSETEFNMFILHFVEGQTHREIAKILKLTRHEVQRCLQAICHRYQSNVLNQKVHTTSKRERFDSINILAS